MFNKHFSRQSQPNECQMHMFIVQNVVSGEPSQPQSSRSRTGEPRQIKDFLLVESDLASRSDPGIPVGNLNIMCLGGHNNSKNAQEVG